MLLSWLALAPALAQDVWSTPHPGVELLERSTVDQQITAAFVDLCTDGLAARATLYEEREQTTSDWAESVGALVAVNGAFFDYTDYDAIGWSIGEGVTWPTAVDYAHYTAIGFTPAGEAAIFDTEDTFPPAGDWLQMVPGDPLLIDDGVIVEEDCFSHMCEDHPRSAVGLTPGGEHVILAVVDGRQTGMAGMTRAELADLMLELGAWRAMNFDGGGSSTLWVEGRGVVNSPSDGSERVVASHLGFVGGREELVCCRPEPVAGATGIFADLADTHWAVGQAEALYDAGITTGCSADPLMFCPDCLLDRAQLGVLVAKAMGLTESANRTFTDVPADAWYAGWIEALREAGVTSGCGTDLYCPDRYATRFELAAFTRRGMGLPDGADTGRFTDVTASQAAEIEPLADACVVNGCGPDTFCPDDEATRAEAAVVLAVGFAVGDYAPCLGETPTEPTQPTQPGTDPTGQGDDTDPADLSYVEPRDRAGCACASTQPVGGLALIPALALVLRRRRTR